MKANQIHNNIKDLLLNREWEMKESKSKYDLFVPPVALGFEPTYKLYLYNKFENADYEKEAFKDLSIISQIYDEDIEELVSIVIEDKQILTLHIEDNSIKNGKPNIPFFANLVENTKELLQDVANFTVVQKPHFFTIGDEAERYVNQCNFLKNDVGSLITKIQLPNEEQIRFGDIFQIPIVGNKINEKLMDIISFVNNQIIGSGNFEPDVSFMEQHKTLISVNVTNKLKSLYLGVDCADMEFTLKGVKINKTVKAVNLNKEKINQLNQFSIKIRKEIKEISNEEVYGKVTELKSKDVDNDNSSTIRIIGMVNHVKTTIDVRLNSRQIKIAADAFKNNKTVYINGVLEKQRVGYRVESLHNFFIQDNEK